MHDRIYDFFGGLALRHYKKMSTEEGIQEITQMDSLAISMAQNIGSMAKPCVTVGEQVVAGQLIGEAGDGLGARIHAPLAGKVSAIAPWPAPHASMRDELSIVLQVSSNQQSIAEDSGLKEMDYRHMTPENILGKIHEAGIVGLGGALFPTAAKLGSALPHCNLVIVNGAECEPYISCDEALMREKAQEIVKGAEILVWLTKAKHCAIAVEDPLGAVSVLFHDLVDQREDDVFRVRHVPTLYPEGGEKQLIKVLTGLEVATGKLPLSEGIIMQNVATVLAIYEAVCFGRPLTHRVVTITGKGIAKPGNYRVPIGLSIANLVAAAGGYTDDAQRLVIGGPMMGFALPNDHYPITKLVNCVLVLGQADIREPAPELPCIRCGDCISVCPSMLQPHELLRFIRAENWAKVEDYSISSCIECGCCEYVCPSHIRLVDHYRFAKTETKYRARQRHKSDIAGQRNLDRESRLQQLQVERKKKMAERKARLHNRDSAKVAIGDSVARARASKEARKKMNPTPTDPEKQ